MGSIAIPLGVLGEKLVREKRAVRPPGDDIGKGAAAVDPELPARSGRLFRAG